MKRVSTLSSLLLIAGIGISGSATAQWFSPWGSENDLATAWGLEPSTLDDPNEGPGETIDYSSPEQPFGMNVQSGSQLKAPTRYAPPAPAPRPAAPAPIAKSRPAPPPKPARPAAPAPRDYYQRRVPLAPRNYGYRQPVRPMPYYAPKPLPPIRMPMPLAPYPYYRR